MIRSIILASALASAGIAASGMTADARTSYDGSWSVLIVTDSGTCDRAYRYGLEISNGNVLYGGGGSVMSRAGSLPTERCRSA